MTDAQPTPMSTLDMAFETAKEEGLIFVYLGNVSSDDRENTYCPHCGRLNIERSGFRTRVTGMEGGKCSSCGHSLNMVI